MIKIIFLLLSFFYISNNVFAQPPGKERNIDWPCIQVYIEELSWGSIWTGPVLTENSAKWIDNKDIFSLAEKLMDRKTKEKEGTDELKKYIKKIKVQKFSTQNIKLWILIDLKKKKYVHLQE